MTPPPTIIAPLPHVAVLKVTGADAGEFLHAQLSNPVGDLPQDSCALAGWHDARGKVRAVFHVLRALDGYLLTAPAALVDQLTTTLGMFILRADVHIERTDLVASGIVAANASTSQAAAPAELPALPKSVNAVNADTNATILCVAPGCWHVLAAANQHSFATGSDCGPIVAAEIRAGLPQVDQQTTLRYVPHMLNLDKLGALDFEKGCYPGQEVIARTEHLGSVKRRARAFRIRCLHSRSSQCPRPARPWSIRTAMRSAKCCALRAMLTAQSSCCVS